jgi:hypothetical protein
MSTVYPHSNPDGLQVRDLIAELQRHHPNDYTDVASITRRGGSTRLMLRGASEYEEDRIHSSIASAKRELGLVEQRLAAVRAEHAALSKNAEAARQILRRLKQLSRTRQPNLP